MKSDVHGCSTCPIGEEMYEEYEVKIGRKTYKRVQYDYRHFDGNLFSCIAKNIDEARQKKTNWIWTRSNRA